MAQACFALLNIDSLMLKLGKALGKYVTQKYILPAFGLKKGMPGNKGGTPDGVCINNDTTEFVTATLELTDRPREKWRPQRIYHLEPGERSESFKLDRDEHHRVCVRYIAPGENKTSIDCVDLWGGIKRPLHISRVVLEGRLPTVRQYAITTPHPEMPSILGRMPFGFKLSSDDEFYNRAAD